MRGLHVRFEVWMKIEWVAVLMICRRKVFSGVGSGIDEKKRSFGFAWCGEGRRMVGMGGVSWGKEI